MSVRCNIIVKCRRLIKGNSVNKACYKAWNKFMKWLRLKKVKVTEDFKGECKLKWQHDENADTLCIKINDKEYDEHMHDKSNKKRKVHAHKGKTEKLSKHYYGVIGTFKKGVLIMINNDKEFHSSEPTEVEVKRLSEEVIQAIKNNEAIAATDALAKNIKIGGAWIIEEDYRINRCKSELVYNQWILKCWI